MRSKDEIGRFSLQPSQQLTVEDLEEHLTDDCDIYHVYLIGNMGYVRDQAQMVFNPDTERAVVAWRGKTETGNATDPEKAALHWMDDHLVANGQ